MNLSRLAVRRPVAVFMLVCIVLLLGGVSFTSLSLDLIPEMQLPIAAVITDYPGAAPLEVEAMVTRSLEEAVGFARNIKNISSTSSPGRSVIIMEFNWGTNMDMALLEVRERLDLVRGFLPAEISSPQVMQADPAMFPIIQLAVTGGESIEDLYYLAETIIKPRLERQEGVAMVSLQGGGPKQVVVTADPFLLGHHAISLEQIAQTIRMENINLAAGSLVEGGKVHQVRYVGEFQDLQDIENLLLTTPRGSYRLGDLVSVEKKRLGAESISRYNGENSISLSITKQSDANTVGVSRRIREEIKELSLDLPATVTVHNAFDQADFINEAIRNVAGVGLVGGLLAVFVLYLFLKSISSTLIIALAIPVSLIATFVLMYFNGLTVNLITLGGLALGLGIMVDNSIVVLENIFRLRQEGKLPSEAAVMGSSQVAGAITAATLTTVIVFLPVAFIEGLAAQIFSPLALTVSFALLASLLIALTVVPVLSSRLMASRKTYSKKNLPVEKSDTRATGGWFFLKVEIAYIALLTWSLNHRKAVMALLTVLLLASLALVPFIGRDFFPTMDDGYISVQATLPVGSSLAETRLVALELEERLLAFPEVDGVFLSDGAGRLPTEGPMRAEGIHIARLEVTLTNQTAREASTVEVAEIMRRSFRDITGAEITVADTDQMRTAMFGGSPLSIAVRGDDLWELKRISQEVAGIVAQVEGVKNVETSFDEGRPELQVTVERDLAASYGLSAVQVAGLLPTALTGQTISRLSSEGQRKDIILILSEETANSREALAALPLLSPLGGLVPLGEIARFTETTGPVDISRYNQVRTALVSGQISGRDLSSIRQDIEEKLADYSLPAGYILDFEGEQQMMQESFEDLWLALLLAIILVYMVMAAQFESLLHPLVIMFTMPQMLIGVILILYLTGLPFSVPAFIGVIMLAGIVVNNGIVLIDYVNLLRQQGLSVRKALLEGGAVRLRPILMTTLTTILGMSPLALGLGTGGEMQAPMAAVVAGGLLFSTLLTLVVVPVIYSFSDELTTWLSKRFSRSKLGTEES